MKLNIARVQPGTLNAKIMASVGYPAAIAALCGLVLNPVYAYADDEPDTAESGEVIVSDQATNASVPDKKTETVYLFANADGSVKNAEVSTALGNPYGAAELADSSELTDIENVESDNGFTGSGSNMVWDAQGEDVYYKGNTDKEAPVSVKVTYYLDGKEVKPADLAGKSGRVKIRYDYDNTATVKATIRGNEEELYVPFTFITALLFDNDNFKNAEVTNGKLIDDGDRVIVAGYAMPGLSKSLGDIVDDFDIPEYFEVEADATDFEMQSSLTIATAGMLDDFDSDDIDTSELEDASSELMDAMDQIIDGADQLKDGLSKLADGAKKADVATGKLASGASDLASGNKQLADGLNTMKDQTGSLTNGVDALADGASSLADGIAPAKAGADQVATGASQLKEALTGIEGSVKEEDIDALVAGADQLSTAVSLLVNGGPISESATLVSPSDLSSNLDQVIGTLKASNEGDEDPSLAGAIKALEQIKAGLVGLGTVATQAEQGANDLKAGIDNAAGKKAEDEGTPATGLYALSSGALSGGAGQVADGANALSKGIDQLDAGAQQLSDGLSTLKGKIPALVEGVNKVATGADQLATGSDTLAKSLEKFDDAMGQLADGTDSAVDGTDKLVEGLGTFKDEGISQISDLIDDDLLPFVDRLDALSQAGKDYDNFGGITEGTQGSVKFVIETDAISVD